MDGQNNGSHYLSVHHFVFNNLRQKVAQPKAEGSCLPPPLLVRSSLLAENTADDHPANRTSFRYGETMSKQTHSLSRRSFLKIGSLALGGLTLPQLLRAEAAGRRSHLAQVGDPDLSGRRSAASGHVRSEAERPEGNRRPVEAHRRPTSPASRFARPCRGWPGSWTSWSSSARWSATRPTTTPFRSSTAIIPRKPTPPGGWPQFGSDGRQAARAGRSGDAAVHQPVLHLHARPLQRAGPRLPRRRRSPRSGRWARRATTWSCSGISVERLADRKYAAEELRRPAPRRRCHAADAGHGSLHRAGVRPAHLLAAGRGPRSVAGGAARRRPLRHRRPEDLHGRQRRAARAAEPADGPPADRGRGPRRHAELQQMGLARRHERRRPGQQLHLPARSGRLPRLRPVRQRPGRGPARSAGWTRIARWSSWASSAGRRKISAQVGRDHWPQVNCRPAGRRRHEDRPGHRRDRPHRRRSRRRGRSPSANCTPRCTTTSAST